MEHFTTIAFWITLLGCLQIKSHPINDFGAKIMREHVECTPDSTFYSPSNVEKRCITTALACVMRELNGTAKEECKDESDYIDLAVETLEHEVGKRSAKGRTLTDSTECDCERWPEKTFNEFLDEAESLLRFANADLLS